MPTPNWTIRELHLEGICRHPSNFEINFAVVHPDADLKSAEVAARTVGTGTSAAPLLGFEGFLFQRAVKVSEELLRFLGVAKGCYGF